MEDLRCVTTPFRNDAGYAPDDKKVVDEERSDKCDISCAFLQNKKNGNRSWRN